MTNSEKFCLRWNDFESNLSGAFSEIREAGEQFDMTLACEDSQIETHKLLLTACSPVFRSLLRNTSHPHPLLYLKGVKAQDLQAVVDFMYVGRVNIATENLNSFLSTAAELRVKGLSQSFSGPNTGQGAAAAPSLPRSAPPQPSKSVGVVMAGKDEKREVAPAEEAGLGEEAEECYITHTEFRDSETGAAADMDTGALREQKGKEFNPRVKNVMSLSEQKLQCLICYKKFSTKEDTAEHMKVRHHITKTGAIIKSMRPVYT